MFIYACVCSLGRSCTFEKNQFQLEIKALHWISFHFVVEFEHTLCLCVLLWAEQTLPLAYTYAHMPIWVVCYFNSHGMACETAFCARRRRGMEKKKRKRKSTAHRKVLQQMASEDKRAKKAKQKSNCMSNSHNHYHIAFESTPHVEICVAVARQWRRWWRWRRRRHQQQFRRQKYGSITARVPLLLQI